MRNRSKHLPQLSRRRIRYLLFRKRDGGDLTGAQARQVFATWDIQLNERDAKKEFDDIIKYYETMPNFTGWSNFAGYEAVGWDIGIEYDDIATKLNRPEKWWLFDKSRHEIVIRGVKKDSRTLVDLESRRRR